MLLCQKKDKYYFRDISSRNAPTQNHVHRLDTHLLNGVTLSSDPNVLRKIENAAKLNNAPNVKPLFYSGTCRGTSRSCREGECERTRVSTTTQSHVPAAGRWRHLPLRRPFLVRVRTRSGKPEKYYNLIIRIPSLECTGMLSKVRENT